MTQDHCLDNGHQAISNNRSTNDQVSDDLNNSKNTAVSNGVDCVQEFNVDVNSKRSEHSVNVAAIVQNRAVDADSPLAVKVSVKSEHSADTSCEFVHPIENLLNTIDVNKSERANNILPDMTVITHQNSSENIRDIIANSDQVNKVTSDSQLTSVGNKAKNEQNVVNGNIVHKSGATKKRINFSRRENNTNSEADKPQDPVERLNKLRASISSALSEVKGVLKQYSTEQSIDNDNESTPSSQPKDDGPVRFRFVRKIRRRSVFSEDDNGEILPSSEGNEKLKLETKSEIENLAVVSNVSQNAENDLSKISSASKSASPASVKNKQNETTPGTSSKDDTKSTKQIPQSKDEEKAHQTLQGDNSTQKGATSQHSPNLLAPIEGNDVAIDSTQPCALNQNKEQVQTAVVGEEIKNTSSNLDPSEIKNTSSSATIKTKIVKSKKVVKKDRRASIAAVELNQVLPDESTSQLELKTLRRPSDSGTLVKQAARVKAKSKLSSLHKVKAVDETDVPTVTGVNADLSSVNLPLKNDEQRVASTQMELKTQLTPPTVEKQAAGIKATTEEKSKSSSQNKVKPSPVDKTEVSVVSGVKKGTTHVYLSSKDSEKIAVSLKELEIHRESSITTTLEKQPAELKPNTEVKPNLSSQQQVKTTAVDKTEVSSQVNLAKDNKKADTSTPLSQLEHKTQPQPSDSGTLVKQAPGIKANTEEKSTLSSQLQVKTTPVHKTEGSSQVNLSKDSEKTATSTQSERQPSTLEKQPAELKANTEVKPNLSSQHVVKTNVPVVAAINTESSQVNLVQKVNEKPTSSTQSTSHLATNKISNTSGASLKVDTVSLTQISNSVDAVIVNNSVVKTEVLKTDKRQTESNNKTITPPNTTKNNKADVSLEEVVSVKDQSINKSETAVELIEVEVPKEKKEDDAENICLDAEDTETNTSQTTTPEVVAPTPKKKRKAKRKVVIRRIKRKLSKDDTFIHTQEAPSELEICEKEIEEKDLDEEESEEEAEIVPKQRKSCLKARQFEIGDVVLYAERYKKTQVKWRKGTVIERITSISYKLDLGGEEKPAHISYIKKFNERKVNFGGKEYLEIDYAQIEEDEEKERNYSIWNLA